MRCWPIIILTLGSSLMSVADAHRDEAAINAKKNSILENRRSIHPVIPSDNMHQIFQNIYHDPILQVEPPPVLSWQEFRAQLKSKLTLNVYENMEIGVDSVNTKSLNSEKREIVNLGSHLTSKEENHPNAHGYGLKFSVKMD